MKLKIDKNSIQFFCLFLYILALVGFNLGTGFDAFFVRFSFILFLLSVLLPQVNIRITGHIQWRIIFWAFYFLSLIWTHNANDTLRYVNECIQILGLALCLPVVVKSKEDIDKVINLTLVALMGAVIRLVIMTPQTIWGTERLGEAIGMNSNVLGIEMSIGALLALYIYDCNSRTEKNVKRNILAVIYIASMIILMTVALFTGSRRTIVILVLGIASYEIFITRGLKILLRIALVVIVAVVFVYFVLTNETLYPILGIRLRNAIGAFLGVGTGGQSITEREYYIQQARALFMENPIFGYGGNNFITYMREIGYTHVAYSHNNFYELLSTLGIIGFGIYYSFWIFVCERLFVLYHKSRDSQVLLFLIITVLEIILDYWAVSYINVFTQLLFTLGYIIIKTTQAQNAQDIQAEQC